MKTALITGASRGIGRAIARKFAQNNYHLILNCLQSTELLNDFAEKLRQTYHVEVMTCPGDVSDFAFVTKMVDSALAQFGQIDVLVNNAGISHIGLLSDMSYEEWQTLMNTNVSSVFSCCKCTIPSMVRRKSGHIVNISSVWGKVGASCEVAYSASKGAVNALTKGLAKELAPSNIQVNAIACGAIDTDMNACFSEEERADLEAEIPAGRYGTPAEVAELAYHLACSSSYLTGQVITFDGGWT
ncbi:MAG: elongation factor P 5-aminopentanone reductase [Roseburia sp.]